MSCNVNNIQKRLIDSLKDKVSLIDKQLKIGNRYIYLSEKEFNQISHSKTSHPLSINNKTYVTFCIDGESYLGVLGIGECSNKNSDLEEVEFTVVPFMSIANSTLPRIIKSPTEIYESLYNEVDSSPDFKGYKLDDVIYLYEPISVFKVPFGYDNYDEKMKAISGLLCDNKEYLALNFTQELINSYRTLCFQEGSCVDNLISSLSSYNWRYAFLDIYRCLEPIFKKPIIYEMFDRWGIDKQKFLDIHHFIKDRFHWVENEGDAMDSLFNNLPEKLKQYFEGLDVNEGNLGRNIYLLRNRIVHYQNHQNEMEKAYSPENWDKLMRALLESLSYFYFHYNNEIS